MTDASRPSRPARPFDATLKHLVEFDPQAWLGYLGLPTDAPAEVIDADLSMVLAEADKVIRVGGERPLLLHIEFQAGRDPDLGERLLQYNVLLRRRHRLPVQSTALLLRPSADSPDLNGLVRLEWTDGTPYLEFRHQVVRVWEQPVERVLGGALATLPLAPLADVSVAELPEVLSRMSDRLRAEASPAEAAELLAATYWLIGARYSRAAARVLEAIMPILEEDSWTYQDTLAREARRFLLRLAVRRFGPPNARARAALEAIDDPDRLEQLGERVLEVGGWDELLPQA